MIYIQETWTISVKQEGIGVKGNRKNLKSQSILCDQYVKLTVKNYLFQITKQKKSKVQDPVNCAIIKIMVLSLSNTDRHTLACTLNKHMWEYAENSQVGYS